MADEKNPFDEELAKRSKDNPFAAELKKRENDEASWADTALDVGNQALRRFNYGVASVVGLPYRAVDWAQEQTVGRLTGQDYMTDFEKLPMWKPFMEVPEAKTNAGRYAGSAGEALGASAIPVAGMMNAARNRVAAAAPGLWGSIKETVLAPFRSNPGAALKADAAANIGMGFGQEAAKDMGFDGPTGQMVGGLTGSIVPGLAGTVLATPARVVRNARARIDPYNKIVSNLEDTSIDELGTALAVGHTRGNEALQTRAFDILGQEMVRHNGNVAAAQAAAVRRIAREDGITPEAAAARLQRLRAANAESELMLAEYPAIMESNRVSRLRNPRNIIADLDAAAADPNREAGNTLRRSVDPGRIEDSNAQWMLDTLANSGGAGSQTVRQALQDRLEGLGDMARQRVASWSPGGQLTQDADAAIQAMERAGNAAYRAVYDVPGTVNYGLLHPLLQRLVDRHLVRASGFNAKQAAALREAIDHLYVTRPAGVQARADLPYIEDQYAQLQMAIREARRQRQPRDVIDNMSRQADQLGEQLRLTRRDASPPTQDILLPSLEQLQNSRQAIRGMIDQYRDTPELRHLLPIVQPLYRQLTRIMERSSPAWRQANDQWAELALDRVARELGESISMQASPQFRQQIRQFNRLAPQAQDFVRIEFAQKLVDKIQNMGEGENIGKIFKTPHVKALIRTMFGEEGAVDMMRMVRDLNTATKSNNMRHGSPTAPRLERQKQLKADLDLVEAANNIPFSKEAFVQKLHDYTVGRLSATRNARMANVLTTPVRNVAQTAEHIERMRMARNLAARYSQPQVAAGRGRLVPTMHALPGTILEDLSESLGPEKKP